MKRVLLLCLIGMAAFATHAATNNTPQPVQAYTAVFWTTTTLHSPSGKATTFMRRTVYTRDASGKLRCDIYRPTKGLLHDVTAPLERTLTGSTSPLTLPHAQSSKETLVKEDDLGTLLFSGVPAVGVRQTFQNTAGQVSRTEETWFAASLGLVVERQSQNHRGDSTLSDLGELHLGIATPVTTEPVSAVAPTIPTLTLYRGLFTHIARMERDRQANDPNRHVNMAQIEDHLRKKLGLSEKDWQVLVDKSVKVESYTREKSKEAHSFAEQDKAARKANPLGPNTLAAGRAKLHGMQTDLNTEIQADIDNLKTAVGPDAISRIQAYLQGPMATSISAAPVVQVRLNAQRAKKEQAR